MRYAVFCLYYAGIAIRAIAFSFYGEPVALYFYALLAAYGLVLVSEPTLSRRLRWYPWVYILLQFGLVVAMLLTVPGMDFLPSLFYPLCFQVVLFFGSRIGFAWIALFIATMIVPVMAGWEWQVEGLAVVVIDGIASLLVGSFAHLIRREESRREANQEMLGQLSQTYRRLQDSANQAEEFAILQERSRMARELHDSVTQTIFSMNLAVQAARLLVGKDLAGVAGQLERLQQLASSAAGEIQVLVSQLRPRSIIADGLPAALQLLAEERRQRDGLQIALEIMGEQDLPQAVQVGLYRIVQEGLNNVAKHAGTKQAAVQLSLGYPAFLEIEDNGCGFEPGAAARDVQHVGLLGMQDRARELGWKLEIDSQPGRGTRIRLDQEEAWQAMPALPAR